ncbi:hypothetical protein MRX96_004907 [Rhipicephalus microplus]
MPLDGRRGHVTVLTRDWSTAFDGGAFIVRRAKTWRKEAIAGMTSPVPKRLLLPVASRQPCRSPQATMGILDLVQRESLHPGATTTLRKLRNCSEDKEVGGPSSSSLQRSLLFHFAFRYTPLCRRRFRNAGLFVSAWASRPVTDGRGDVKERNELRVSPRGINDPPLHEKRRPPPTVPWRPKMNHGRRRTTFPMPDGGGSGKPRDVHRLATLSHAWREGGVYGRKEDKAVVRRDEGVPVTARAQAGASAPAGGNVRDLLSAIPDAGVSEASCH